MENLTPEGKAIYDMIKKASEAAHARCQKELDELIVAAVGRVVDKAVSAAVGTIVNDMQAYTEMPKRISSSRSRSFVQRRVSPPTRATQIRSSGLCRELRRPAPMGTACHQLHGGRDWVHLRLTSLLRHEVSPNYPALIRPSPICYNENGGVDRLLLLVTANHRQ